MVVDEGRLRQTPALSHASGKNRFIGRTSPGPIGGPQAKNAADDASLGGDWLTRSGATAELRFRAAAKSNQIGSPKNGW
jgi:hypothetical protein